MSIRRGNLEASSPRCDADIDSGKTREDRVQTC